MCEMGWFLFLIGDKKVTHTEGLVDFFFAKLNILRQWVGKQQILHVTYTSKDGCLSTLRDLPLQNSQCLETIHYLPDCAGLLVLKEAQEVAQNPPLKRGAGTVIRNEGQVAIRAADIYSKTGLHRSKVVAELSPGPDTRWGPLQPTEAGPWKGLTWARSGATPAYQPEQKLFVPAGVSQIPNFSP